jgi:hypothetical protein
MFILAKATIVPFFMILKLLEFIGIVFVAKLTKQVSGYYKGAYWSNGVGQNKLARGRELIYGIE